MNDAVIKWVKKSDYVKKYNLVTMLLLIILISFCIGLTFFLYLKKSPEKAAPDYSYIIFKDYSLDYSKIVLIADDRVVKEITTAKEEEKTESMSPQKDHPQDEPPVATLHFED